MYWTSVLKSKETKLVNVMYSVLLRKYNDLSFLSGWVDFVFYTLNTNGLGFIWFYQSPEINRTYVKSALKEKLVLQFIQEWHSTLVNSSKCVLYRLFKADFKLENYLLITSRELVKYIVKFRCSNHKLAVETGRYINIDRDL